jgi:Secretion system C-terminal sorting domain
MKIPLLLLTSIVIPCLNISAQESKPNIDESKRIGYSSPSHSLKTELAGEINTPSVDLTWQPILTHKIQWSEPKTPDEEVLDSIVAVKDELKKVQSEGYKNAIRSIDATNPTISHNFQGNSEDGFSPLDNNMAISNGGIIVSVTNTIIQYYDTLGNRSYSNDLVSFINNQNITGVCDPTVFYDAGSDRFILFCQEYPLGANDKIIICFSKTNKPANGWWVYTLTGDPLGVGDAFDYPKIAVSNNELFISGNLYGQPSNNYDQSVVYQIDKTNGYSGASLTWQYWSNISGSPFTLLPVSYGQNGTYGPGIYLISTKNSGGSAINLYEITNDQYHNPVMNYYTVATSAYSPAGNASQLGTSCKLNSGLAGCRALSGFYLNGLIHFVFHCDIGSGWSGINYNRLNVSLQTDKSVKVGDAGSVDFAYPSVVSYATSPTDATVIVGFGVSGAAIYPEVGVMSCDNSMNWSPNYVVVHPGSGYVSYTSNSLERWGDYSGASRFHKGTSPTIWMNGAYGTNTKYWSTWIAEVTGKNAGTGIDNLAAASTTSAKVYPNPIANTFNVDFTLNTATNLTINILDMDGKIVKQLYAGQGKEGDNNFSFNKANLSSGIYFLVIRNEEQIIKSEKVVITD